MAGRRGTGDGVLASTLSRADVRRVAGILGLGFALSALAYGTLYAPLEAWHKGYGWRGMLILGVLPALAVVWIRIYVKEPEVWTENKKIQNTAQKQVSLPLFAIFKPKYLFNTFTGIMWMAANFSRLLFGLGDARDLPDEGTGLDAGAGVGPGVLGQHPHVPLLRHVRGHVGTHRTAVGADHSARNRHVPGSPVTSGRPTGPGSWCTSCCSSASSAERMR